MQVLVLAAPRQGIGRTTLAYRLARQASRAGGGPVVLLDADPEGDLSKRCADGARPDALSDLIVVPWDRSCAGPEFQQLKARAGGVIIIDAPLPDRPEALGETLSVADLIAVVVRPREDDIALLGPVVAAIEAADRPCVFLVNRAKRHGNMAAATSIALAQYGTVCPIVLPEDEKLAPSLRARVFRRPKRGEGETKRAEVWSYLSERLDAICGTGRGETSAGPGDDAHGDRAHDDRTQDEAAQGEGTQGEGGEGGAEHRQFVRHSFEVGATFSWEGQSFPCRIRNVSAGGLAFTTDMPVPVGTRLKVRVPYLGDFDAVSVHRDAVSVGLRFVIDEWQQAALVRDLAALVGGGRVGAGQAQSRGEERSEGAESGEESGEESGQRTDGSAAKRPWFKRPSPTRSRGF